VQDVDQLSVRWGGTFAQGLNRGSLGESVEPGQQANALTTGKLVSDERQRKNRRKSSPSPRVEFMSS
jgi:hypothetical protein